MAKSLRFSSCFRLRRWISSASTFSNLIPDQNSENSNHTLLRISRTLEETTTTTAKTAATTTKKKGVGSTKTASTPHPDPLLESHVTNSIYSLAVSGNGSEALRLFKMAFTRLNLFEPKVSTCNILMASLGTLEEILFVYKEMIKSGLLPDADTLDHLVRALAVAGRVDSAVDQMKRFMRRTTTREGCFPNARTFETLFRALFRSDDVDSGVDVAAALLRSMLRKGCPTDARFFYNLIPLFCESGRLQEAEELFRRMSDGGIAADPTAVGSFALCLCENGRVVDAARVLQEHVQDVQIPATDGNLSANNNSIREAYNAVVRGFCEIAETTKAFEVIKTMISSSLEPDADTGSAVVLGFCRMRRHATALDYCRRLCVKNGWLLDPTSYSELIRGLCLGHMIEEASEVFLYMSGGRGGVPLDGDCLDMLIDGICQRGKVKEAIAFRSLALSCGTPSGPDTFAAIIRGLPESNKARNLLPFFSQMIVEGFTLESRVYNLLIHYFCTKSLIREASVLFGKMVSDVDIYPDPGLVDLMLSHLSKSKSFLLHTLAGGLIRVAELGADFGPDAYNIIISTLLKEGRKIEASKFLDLMLERGWVPGVETHNLVVGRAGDGGTGQLDAVTDIDIDGVVSILDEGLR